MKASFFFRCPSYQALKCWLLPTLLPCWWYNWFSRNNTKFFEKLFWDLSSPHSGDGWASWGVSGLNDTHLEQQQQKKRGLNFIWAPYFSRNVLWKMVSYRGPACSCHFPLYSHDEWRRPYLSFLRIPKNSWVFPCESTFIKFQVPFLLMR